MINIYERYQTNLKLIHLYPSINGVCCCGCGRELPKQRRRWYSDECFQNIYTGFEIIKGKNTTIRKEVFKRDKGICNNCHKFSHTWQADHIIPVFLGGGGCGLDNYQTLCLICHKQKTKENYKIKNDN